MPNEVKTWLQDISNAIIGIEIFVSEKNDYESFKADLKTRRAVERNLEIIGEAMKRILSLQPNIPIIKSRLIVDTRNRIIHGYDSISEDIIWTIVKRELPMLKAEVQLLLNK